MLQGKKHLIEKIMYNSFFQIKKKYHRQPLRLLFLMLMKLKPFLGFISKRLGKE
jgi:ribosomal protein S7